jgi:hypothetical protein
VTAVAGGDIEGDIGSIRLVVDDLYEGGELRSLYAVR